MRRPTALLIPSPWSGDENDPVPFTYRLWWPLYVATRVVRHWFNRHDWETIGHPRQAGWYRKCSWCGDTTYARQSMSRSEVMLLVGVLLVFMSGLLLVGLKNGWS